MINIYKIIFIVIWISFILIFSFVSKKYFPKQKELGRKIIHIGIGPLIPFALWAEIPEYFVIPISLGITCSLIINYKFRFLSLLEDIERNSFGTISYASSITILFILFWKESPYAVISGVLVMAFADGLAGLLGRYFKSPHWQILGQNKSIIGTFTMASVTFFILLSLIITSGSELNITKIIFVTLLTTAIEQCSPLGIDNITVPLTVGYSWSWMINI